MCVYMYNFPLSFGMPILKVLVLLPWQEQFELVRVFDSLIYEDESIDEITAGISASGTLDSSQTRDALHLESIKTCII